MKKFWKNNKGILVGLFLLLFFRSAIADWYQVPSGSMQPNILIGDRVWVNKLAYDVKIPFSDINLNRHAEPQVGDVVVFQSAVQNERLIKRVIGVPGDKIALINNRLVVNDRPVDFIELAEPQNFDKYLQDRAEVNYVWESRVNSTGTEQSDDSAGYAIRLGNNTRSILANFSNIEVKPGHLWVMGDNRDNSADSRVIGFVPRNEIIGRAERVVVSLNPENYYLPREDRYWEKL